MTLSQVMLPALVVMVAATLAGMVPQRLRRAVAPGAVTWRSGAALSLCAAVAGLITLASSLSVFGWETALALALLAVALAAMAVVDALHLVIPDLHVAMIVALALFGPLAPPLTQALLGAALAGGLLWLVRYLHGRARGQEGLGLGDVKLAAALGALVGPMDVLWVIVGGAVIGIVLVLARGRDRMTAAPLGATLAAPALAVTVFRLWTA